MDKTIAKQFPVQQRVVLRALEVEAIELAAQGLNQREIGERIGRTRSAVGKMLRRTERKLYELLKETGQQIKGAQTAKLDHIYREAMQAWERSKSDAESVKTIEDSGKDGTKKERTTRGQTGDARFLDQARGALSDVRRIWGLDEASTQTSNANVTIRVEYADDFFGRTVIDSHGVQVEETRLIPNGHDGHDSQED